MHLRFQSPNNPQANLPILPLRGFLPTTLHYLGNHVETSSHFSINPSGLTVFLSKFVEFPLETLYPMAVRGDFILWLLHY